MRHNGLEPEEILLDSSVVVSKMETPIKNKRALFLYPIFFVLLAVILAVSFYDQAIKGNYYRARAELNAARFYKIPAPRGIIYDKNNLPLVYNQPEFDLISDVDFLKHSTQEDKDFISSELNKILGNPAINLNYQPGDEEATIVENIPQEKVINLLNSDLLSNIKALKIESTIKRFYPFEESISHLLGYIGKISRDEYKVSKNKGYKFNDLIGKSGLELFYENDLRGVDGYKKYEIDATGKILGSLTVSPPRNGKDLVLSIDAKLTEKIYEILKNYIYLSENQSAAVVAVNPNNGKVLSMVSMPSFDNNIFTFEKNRGEYSKLISDKRQPLFNRAITGTYPSGSVIKPFVASAALEENIISPDKKFFAPASISIQNIYNPEIIYTFHDWKEHGLINMREAIAYSSNVYFYTIGGGWQDIIGLGPEKLRKYLSFFGFGKETGIDIYGEAVGFIPSPEWKKTVKGEGWYIGDTYNFSIGQGDFLTTPLQVAMGTASIANGGKLFAPEIIGGSQPKVIRENFIKPENLKVVREGMRMAVTDGSARFLNSLSVKAAAKTGTAQNPFGATHAWATIFAPYDNPQIALTVLLERAGEGSAVAVPVAKEILDWYFSKNIK